MSTTNSTTETSIHFSLAELAKIEQERVRAEEVRRAQDRERAAREKREAEARRRAEEEAEIAAQAEARARRVREEAIEKARIEAREKAAMDVARIEAEAKAKLEADNAARAHELAVIRVRTESGLRRRATMLVAALGILVCAGSAAAYGATRRVAALEQDAEQLREQQSALGKEREQAKASELSALDRRFALLAGKPFAKDAEDARGTAQAARNAVDVKTLDNDRLRAFSDALDAFEAKIAVAEKIAGLDRRQADLATWSRDRKKADLLASAKTAEARAKATGTPEAIAAYETSLNQIRDALAQSNGAGHGSQQITKHDAPAGTCAPGDPGCDLNGHPLF